MLAKAELWTLDTGQVAFPAGHTGVIYLKLDSCHVNRVLSIAQNKSSHKVSTSYNGFMDRPVSACLPQS